MQPLLVDVVPHSLFNKAVVVRFILVCIFCGFVTTICAIGLADFVPNFLATKQANKNSSNKYKNNEQAKLAAPYYTSSQISKNSQKISKMSNYCSDTNGAVSGSVFCKKHFHESNVRLTDLAKKPSSVDPSDPTRITNIAPNQTAMQSQDLKNALNKYTNNFMLSVQPKKDLDIGMGVTEQGLNELQFKMKY